MKTSLTRMSVPAVAVAFAFLLAPAAEARPGADSAERIAKKEQYIERKVQKRLAPKLGLDERATERLATLMKEKARERHAIMREVRQERQALRALLESGASEGELSGQLTSLQAAVAKMPSKGALIDEARSFLTVEQQAQLALMGPKLHGKHGKYGKRGKGMRMKERPAAPE